MIVLLTYIAVSILISHFLEQRRWKIANIAHTVLFTVFFFLLLCLFGGSGVISVMERLLGQTVYRSLVSSLIAVDADVWLSPLAIMEIVLLFLSLLVGSAATYCVIATVARKQKLLRQGMYRAPKKLAYPSAAVRVISAVPLYAMKCVFLC